MAFARPQRPHRLPPWHGATPPGAVEEKSPNFNASDLGASPSGSWLALFGIALTAVMLVVVNTVSALVHVYSIGYMSHDEHQPRFFAFLSLFTFAMLMLVTANNLLQMFFGWEGVGLASYLLIGFWSTRARATASANSTARPSMRG